MGVQKFYIFVFNFNPLHGNDNETSLWVENLGNSALSILGNPNITNDKKEIFLEEIFINNLDIKRVSLFVLGPYRKRLDKEDSLKYYQSIEDFISKVYAKRLLSYPSGNIQIIKIIIASFIAIIIFAIITGQSVAYYISGLGALTAVLLLVFQDTILSFVASVQIGQNDIIKIGDWIEVPEFGADGDVVGIGRTFVDNVYMVKEIGSLSNNAFIRVNVHSGINTTGIDLA